MNASVTAVDLGRIGPGFADPALQSQAVFRATLQVLARPGTIQALRRDEPLPRGADAAAALVLLALLDHDCRLWLSPSLARGDAGAWLRFHTGCRIVDAPAAARFAWIAGVGELPSLADFAQGSEFEPETAATCIVQVREMVEGSGWTLGGPGIRGRRRLEVEGLGADFVRQWRVNHASFPCGVDLLLTAGSMLAGLPRTCSIED
jgi:alpha-D-ribose 1-methylphosphonate 5-triphosphate synthase subunit PhnH